MLSYLPCPRLPFVGIMSASCVYSLPYSSWEYYQYLRMLQYFKFSFHCPSLSTSGVPFTLSLLFRIISRCFLLLLPPHDSLVCQSQPLLHLALRL